MRTTFLILVLAIAGNLLRAESSRVQFFDGSFQEMRLQAIQQQKPYMVFFYTDWCNPCQNMQKYTFSKAAVSKYVKEHYMAFSSNAESLEPGGNELALRFRITFYPTILIIGADGKERERLGGFIGSDALLKVLEKHTSSAPIAATPPPVVPASNARTAPPIVPPVSTLPSTQPPKVIPSNTSPAPMASSSAGLAVETLPLGSFAVQIGVFKGFENVIKEVRWLEEKGFDAAVIHTKIDGQDAFKVMVGPFSTKEAASFQKKSLAATGKQGFIILIS